MPVTALPYVLDKDDPNTTPMGLIALQTDETIESELANYFSDLRNDFFVTRVPSSLEVTQDTLAAMQSALPSAAALLPSARRFSVIGYGCTSASSVIGSDRVATLVKSVCDTAHVTNPLQATLACAKDLGLSRMALLSPYIEEVNATLRQALSRGGLTTDVFGSFEIMEEAKVVRISKSSIVEAAVQLGQDTAVEGVFISCTNLRTVDALPEIEKRIGKPVLSSNQSLAWHMRKLSKQTTENT